MKHAARLALLLGIALAPGALHAQAWPERSITLVVPYAPGGYTDLTARLTARYLEKTLGKVAAATLAQPKSAQGSGWRKLE